MTDTYEGWSNRETWCAQLWMANEQGIYEDVREQARDLLMDALEDCASDEPGDSAGSMSDAVGNARYRLAIRLETMWSDWAADLQSTDTYSEGLALMVLDVGSLYRVDWYEIADHWIADAREELEQEARDQYNATMTNGGAR